MILNNLSVIYLLQAGICSEMYVQSKRNLRQNISMELMHRQCYKNVFHGDVCGSGRSPESRPILDLCKTALFSDQPHNEIN